MNFTTPNPTLVDFAAAITALQTKVTARSTAVEAAKQATLELHAAELAYDQKVTQLAAYAENVTAGDAAKLQSGGFELRKEPTPMTGLGQVRDLRVITNGYAGRFVVDWLPLLGAKSYEVQISVDPVTEASWKTIQPSPAKTPFNLQSRPRTPSAGPRQNPSP